jgi:hypothetical protein
LTVLKKKEPIDSKVNESIGEFEERRTVRGLRVRDWLYYLGAGLGAVSSTAFLFGQVLPFSGAIPFLLISYVDNYFIYLGTFLRGWGVWWVWWVSGVVGGAEVAAAMVD